MSVPRAGSPVGADVVVTYQQLWAANPGRWHGAAAAWRSLVSLVDRRAAEVAAHRATLGAAWSGAAAGAAQSRLDLLRGQLLASRAGWLAVDQALTWYATELARARAMLDAAVTAAEPAGVTVDLDGRAGAVAGPVDAARAAALRRVGAQISAALTAAARADAQTAGELGALAAAAAAGWPTAAPTRRVADGSEPAAVRAWWDSLGEAQRRWLVAHEPAALGRLDGIPIQVRDRANRLLLGPRRDRLVAARQEAVSAGRAAQVRRIDAALRGVDAVAARLAATTGPRMYLLRLDVADDGRAVIAVGDPDRADNVLTYVPGMTACLAQVDGELERARRVAETAQRLDPGERTAAVLWLDYDAPDFVREAASTAQASAAGPALHRFQEGLRATQLGPAAQHTVLGHSYGSVVVGTTAARHGLAADSLVFVGSPGVGAGSAAELRMPTGQVWSTTAATDVIQYAAVAPRSLLPDLARSVAVPVLGPALAFGPPEDELWHGRNPSDPSFGARVFTSQVGAGHVGYWQPGGVALDSLARITLGGAHQELVR